MANRFKSDPLNRPRGLVVTEVTENRLRGIGVAPLTPEEVSRADQVALRLHGVLKTLVESLPEHARGASGMARHLSVVRNTCQRVVTALGDVPTVEMLTKLPGVRGLELFIEGFQNLGADEATLASAATAIEQFDQLLREVGSSQSKLAERVDRFHRTEAEETGMPPARAAEMARQQLFQAAVKVMDRECEVKVNLYVFRIHPEDPSKLERVLAQGEVGQFAGPNAMPIAFHAGDTRHQEKHQSGRIFSSLDRTPAHGHTPSAILEEFCTDPLPLVTSRGSEGRVVQMIDHKLVPKGERANLILANRSVHPALIPDSSRSSLDEVWTLVNYPARNLLLDIYLHRDMERLFRPSIDVQLWGPNLDSHPADRWITRFPHGPRLQLLSPGLRDAHSDAYPRHAELSRALFKRINWNPDDFIGFRCEVAYPIWRGGYCIRFEEVSTEPRDG